MFANRSIDEYVPESILRDVRRTVAHHREHGREPRIIAMHAEDFAACTKKINEAAFMPYCPTLCGIPVTPWEQAEIAVFAPADDNTPVTVDQAGQVREEVI
jgi:hypothetical protein